MDGSTPGARSTAFQLTRLSRHQRILVVAGIACLLAAAGLVSYRWYMRPTTLTVAVGSQDGEAPKMVAAIAAHLAQTSAPVRLSMKETPSALEAAATFASGAVDLAVVRGDAANMSQARAVVVVTRGVVLLVAPPGSPIDDVDGLKRVTIGVVGALSARIRMAGGVGELDEIDDEIDRLLRSQRIVAVADDAEASDVTSLNVAAHRLETLISDRRTALSSRASEKTTVAPGPALKPLTSSSSQ